MGRLVMSLLVYSSRTGNTKTFVDYITSRSNIEVGDYNSNINEYETIIIGAYTWGDGKIPADLKEFAIRNQHNWKGKKVFIFGSGVSVYPKFCGAVDGIKKIVEDCGAEVIGIFKFEQRFKEKNYSERFLNRIIEKIK
jgi:flavodoxin I